MLARLKSLLKRSRILLIAYLVVSDFVYGLKARLGDFRSSSGSRHAGLADVRASLDYIDGVFTDYLRYGGLAPGDLAQKRVLEVGPGDNLGVALRFLVAGAAHVTCLDKFYSVRDDAQQIRIYQALRERLSGGERELFDGCLQINGHAVTPDVSRIRYVCGHGIEDAVQVLDGEKFDVIVSRAVMEHVSDPAAAFAVMDALLKPGGKLVHKVDLRDHGLFSGYGYHPLTFLTVPDRLYGAMVRHSGRPNRALLDEYRDLLARLNYRTRFLVTHVLGGHGDLVPHPELADPGLVLPAEGLRQIEEIRPRLLERYRGREARSLMVTGVFLIAEKASDRDFRRQVSAA